MSNSELKKVASVERHGALTISRPRADMRRLIRRLAHLNVLRVRLGLALRCGLA